MDNKEFQETTTVDADSTTEHPDSICISRLKWYKVFACSAIPGFGLLYLKIASKKAPDPGIREYAAAAFRYRLGLLAAAVAMIILIAAIVLPYVGRFMEYMERL